MDEMQFKLIESVVKGATEGTIEGGKELAKSAAVSAWKGLKSLLGFKDDAKPEEVKAKAAEAIAKDPQREAEIARILNDYRTQIAATQGGVAGRDYFDNRGANINIQGGAKFGGG